MFFANLKISSSLFFVIFFSCIYSLNDFRLILLKKMDFLILHHLDRNILSMMSSKEMLNFIGEEHLWGDGEWVKRRLPLQNPWDVVEQQISPVPFQFSVDNNVWILFEWLILCNSFSIYIYILGNWDISNFVIHFPWLMFGNKYQMPRIIWKTKEFFSEY